MYKKILIPLDNSPTDKIILEHIRSLGKLTNASLVLIHVADGFAARFQDQLNLQDSQEITEDRLYLNAQQSELQKEGFRVKTYLAKGEPAKEIIAVAQQEQCDLIAMSTHGHRLVKDIFFGSVAENIRHQTNIPILMIKA